MSGGKPYEVVVYGSCHPCGVLFLSKEDQQKHWKGEHLDRQLARIIPGYNECDGRSFPMVGRPWD